MRQIGVGVVVVAVGAALWAQSATETRFARAKEKAVEYFATRVHHPDPTWVSLFAYMHRRFGLMAQLASGQRADDISAQGGRAEGIRQVYGRIQDPRVVVGEWQIAALPSAMERMTANALHCDRVGLPADWIGLLRKAAAEGGYALTHSVRATEWSVENGCLTRADAQALRADQLAWLVTFVQRRQELGGQLDAITDVWIEAVAMLYYVGAGNMVRPEWVEEIVRLQNDDGGWSRSPTEGGSDPHTTAVALWVILEHLQPDVPRTPWIQQVG